MKDKISIFISQARKTLRKYGVRCNLTRYKKVKYFDGTYCSGYFDSNMKVLVVATDRPRQEWFETFIHEYCHFEQWVERTRLWRACELKNGDDVLIGIVEHFDGKIKLNTNTLKSRLNKIAKLEKDCEIRALSKIEEYGLPVNMERYAKIANSLITLYYVMAQVKRWCDMPPYNVKEIISKMPKYVKGVDHRMLANRHLKLYKKHCKV